jgi:hypothetical protein
MCWYGDTHVGRTQLALFPGHPLPKGIRYVVVTQTAAWGDCSYIANGKSLMNATGSGEMRQT